MKTRLITYASVAAMAVALLSSTASTAQADPVTNSGSGGGLFGFIGNIFNFVTVFFGGG